MRILIKMCVAIMLCSVGTVGCARNKEAPGDPMAWLGPMPAKLSEEMLEKKSLSLQERIARDLRTQDIDLEHFVCKDPVDVGPVPQMEAVRAYLAAWPDNTDEPELVRGLQRAAAAGNWLARVQLFIAMEPKSTTERYRHLQLAEWMQRQKLGALYAQFGDSLAASGYYSDVPGGGITGVDVYAALHGSYPAQNKVGKALSGDAATATVGRAMLACASAALPEYARIFSGAAEQAARQRREAARDAALPPLHRAVRSGDPETVSRQLAAAPDAVNSPDEDEQSALDLAMLAKPPHPAIVRLLIERGARVSEDHRVGSRGDDTQLGLAVAAPAPANLDLVKLLMQAGADPFATNKVHEYVFQTPFADAADRYDDGKDEAIFEFMLASGRLAARSALATAYADHYAGSTRVFDRLLAYGAVPSGEMFTKLVNLDEAGTAAALQRLRALLGRHPHLRGAMRTDQGAAALSQAVYNCRFELAIALADLGAPFKGGLVGDVAERCGDADMQARGTATQPRRKFLELLAARGYDLDGGGFQCVGWMPSCMLRDEAVVRELLALGADPYRLLPGGDTNGVLAAIGRCNVALAELMLAKPPKTRNDDVKASLDRAAEQAAEPYFCPAGTDMQGVLARLLAHGAAQPVPRTVRPR